MIERRLQRKFEWAELPAVLAEGPLRLNGAGVDLAESVFSSDDAGNFTPCKLWIVMHSGATKRPARFRIHLDPPYVWINAARRRGDIDLCNSGSHLAVCQPAFLETAALAPSRRQRPHCQGHQIRKTSRTRKPSTQAASA